MRSRNLVLTAAALGIAGSGVAWTGGPGPLFVFFDGEKINSGAGAEEALDRAAKAFREEGAVRIRLVGRADRTGSEAHNLDLSRRRAEAVKALLAARRVPLGVITVTATGEQDPVVTTADGVREPQNRSVEIRIEGGGPSE